MKVRCLFLFCNSLRNGARAASHSQAPLERDSWLDPGTDWNGDGTVDSKLDEWVEIVNSAPAAG
jgi:hypothetical protein